MSCGTATSAVQPVGLEAKLDSLVPGLLQDHKVPGVSIAIIRGGEVTLSKAYGLADRAGNEPATTATRFNIGSVSKTMTAWGVMALAEETLIDLDAPVDRYLRRWHLPESPFDNSKVTVRRLLNHTAGLSVYPTGVTVDPAGLFAPGSRLPTIAESLARVRGTFGRLRLVGEPGKRFQYNNGDYAILQLLIEEVTGESFEQYMRRLLFVPLSMAETGYSWTAPLARSVATPHDGQGKPWPHYLGVEQGSGGVYTTASDLARFVAATSAGGGAPPGRGILSPKTVREMLTPTTPAGEPHGLGYKLFDVTRDVRLASHDGANEGFRAMYMIEPGRGDGLTILTNSDDGGRIIAPIVCAWSTYTTIDMSVLCKSVR
jgi:CubicO group peptidase (beta-lactamase class C family)